MAGEREHARSRVNLLNWDGGRRAHRNVPRARDSDEAAVSVRERSTDRAMQDRLVWQAASLLLAYPDDRLAERLDTVDELLGHISGPAAALLAQTVAALRAREPMAAAVDYVETFDMRRRATMYLTYWTAGDTRNRGREMLAFATAYRDAGARTAAAARRPTTCPWCSSSPPPSIPRPDGDC